MNLIRNGKIARLPKTIREELNRRLDNGSKGRLLLSWLNSLPEVQSVLAAHYGGKPVNKQSLSKWRRGGYTDWLRQQQALELAKEMAATLNFQARLLPPPSTLDSQPSSNGGEPPLSDQASAWLALRYLMAVRKLVAANGAAHVDVKVFHEFSRDLVALRRGDHCAARLKLDQDRLKRRDARPRATSSDSGNCENGS